MTTFEEELRCTIYPLVDGHTHVDQYETADFAVLLERARLANIGLIIAAATTILSCERIVHLAAIHPIIRGGIGLHPADLQGPIDDRVAERLHTLASDQHVVEWSECGLDYLPTSPDHRMQQEALRTQIKLAKSLGLPLVIHSREADDDALRILIEEHAGDVGGAWHYFGGSLELAERIMDIGFNISLAKPLLREEALQKVAAQLPMGQIVIETDCYPQSFKKNPLRRTEPWHLPQVAEKLAELQGIDIEFVAKITTSNYLRMLKGRVNTSDLPLAIH